MATEKITMPKLGESVTEGTINSWLVKEGDKVNLYDPLADIMTDKVNAEVPSSFSGVIKELVAKEGDTVDVGETICYIETESVEDTSNDIELEKNTELEVPPSEENKVVAESEDQSMKKRYSPAVLRMAQENDIDLASISGTGRSGRITRKDIERVISIGDVPMKDTEHLQNKKASVPSPNMKSADGNVVIPVTGVRKAIAEKMVRSTQEIPHAWMTVEVDVTDLVKYRNEIKDTFKQKEGYNLTYFSFFVKAVAQALKEYPQLNSVWAGENIIQRKDINVSIAVAKDHELFVPVIKNADDKSLKGIAKDVYDLATKARAGKLVSSDMDDGTFTVNNTGSFGSIYSMGIINHPQAAILQIESIVKRPMIINDMFAARDMVNLSLSLDHRILDGLVCGKFLARVKELLENTNQATTNIY